MPFSDWITDFVLPGSDASSVTQQESFSQKFEWPNEGDMGLVTYYSRLNSVKEIDTPEKGGNIGVVINGVREFEETNRKLDYLFNATPGLILSSSSSSSLSSSSISSCSCSSSSCSSSCSSWLSSSCSSSSNSSCSSSCSSSYSSSSNSCSSSSCSSWLSSSCSCCSCSSSSSSNSSCSSSCSSSSNSCSSSSCSSSSNSCSSSSCLSSSSNSISSESVSSSSESICCVGDSVPDIAWVINADCEDCSQEEACSYYGGGVTPLYYTTWLGHSYWSYDSDGWGFYNISYYDPNNCHWVTFGVTAPGSTTECLITGPEGTDCQRWCNIPIPTLVWNEAICSSSSSSLSSSSLSSSSLSSSSNSSNSSSCLSSNSLSSFSSNSSESSTSSTSTSSESNASSSSSSNTEGWYMIGVNYFNSSTDCTGGSVMNPDSCFQLDDVTLGCMDLLDGTSQTRFIISGPYDDYLTCMT